MERTGVSTAATIIFGTSFVAVLLVVAILGAWTTSRQLDRLALERAEFQARILADDTEESLEYGSTVIRSLGEILSALLTDRPLPDAATSAQVVRTARNELLIDTRILELALYLPDGQELWRVPRGADRPEGYTKTVTDLISAPATTGFALTGRQESENRSVLMARKVTDTSGSPVAVFTVHVSLGEEFFKETAETVPDIDALRLDSSDGERILAHVLDDSSTLARDWAAGPSPGVGSPATGIVGGTHRAEVGHAAVASVQVRGFPIVASGLYDKSSETLRHTWETIITGTVAIVLGAASTVLLVLLIRRTTERARLMQSHVTELAEDVEELERRDEKRNLLMREVHHRVKNNLLIISNVIEMIIAGGGPFTADTLRDIESRIAAVQQIHDALYRSADPADLVRMDTYLDSLVEKIMSSVAGPQVWSTVDVEAVELPAREAITLGLLSTEIITNAIKHGVVEGGAIMITGRSHESGFRIRYWNDGRPYRATKPGMGTLLINALVEQLDGTLELDTEDGTCWTLTIDLDHLGR